MSFRDWISKSPQAPPWLQGPWGKKLMEELGTAHDDQVDRLKESVKARYPDYAPYPDGTREIGFDRQLPQGPSESEASHRARLKNAWELWEMAGTHKGILLELQAQGFPMDTTGAHIVQHNGLYSYLDSSDDIVIGLLGVCINRYALGAGPYGLLTQPGDLPGWTFEVDNGRDQFFSQFGIVFPADVAALRPGTETATLLNASVNKWKPVRHYRGAVVVEAGRCVGWPVGTELSDLGNVGGSTCHFIPPV